MKNLKSLRLEKGLSQQKLADILNISQQSIYKYENNISEPDIAMLITIANYFGTSIDYLVGNTSIRVKYDHYTEEKLTQNELNHLRYYLAD